jgi:hypothetical protein
VCPPSEQPDFKQRRAAKRLVSVPTRCSVYTRFVLLLPRSSQQIRRAGGPSRHASGPPAPKKVGFTRNRTRPTTKSNPFQLLKKQTKATGNDGGDLRCAEKKGERIRLAGTISREVMRISETHPLCHCDDRRQASNDDGQHVMGHDLFRDALVSTAPLRCGTEDRPTDGLRRGFDDLHRPRKL